MKIKTEFFEFSSYKFVPAKKQIGFKYKIGFVDKKPLVFVENIILPKVPEVKRLPKGLLDNLLQAVHLVLGISYYKLYCPPQIKISKSLSKEQARFWETVYRKGLGEFFYRNKLNPKIVKFPCSKAAKPRSYELARQDRALAGVGGGKDSIVAVELLKENHFDITGFVVETERESGVSNAVLETSGIKALKIRRFLDRKILGEPPGIYQGHIPISAIYGFLGLMAAVLYDYSDIIVANEYSSNFGNVEYKGETINHQWSKSQEFEELFQGYIKEFVSPNIKYFSVLRPFYEIRIVRHFSKYRKYFPYFSSCNRNFALKQTGLKHGSLWCGKCPKCVFLFTLLSAFLSKKELLRIFGRNLYQDKGLLPAFSNILGLKNIKPFDCVGTFEEAQAALHLAKEKFRDDFIVKTLSPKIIVSQKTIKKVFSAHLALNIPTRFRFLGMENVLILGYGREGRITRQYLKTKFPELKIGIADQKEGSGYLKKQEDYDIAVRTPGLPKKKITIQYATATNIFFSQVKNKVIGVTGSKGKSTTASLIYEILRSGGRKAQLLGNIGKPMLGALASPFQKNEVLVLEISSYQLDDIEFSPQIAVITNLFPEHMDYHEGTDRYFEAKKNIIKFQRKSDFFVYNPKVRELIIWAKEIKSQAVPFSQKIPLKSSEIPLLGEHNKDNIKAAITAARILKISEAKIKKAIKGFKPLSHRLEFIGEFQGIKFYDDAISTTPESTIMAIRTIPNVETIFLGGEDRGYNFCELERSVKKYKIKNVVLFPESGKRMFKQRRGLNVLETSKMAEAVAFAYENTSKGKTCLLSTASPSYTLWKNFEEKGREFQLLVKHYVKCLSKKTS